MPRVTTASVVSAAFVLAVLSGVAFAQEQSQPITPETSTVTSTVTNCMMSCNSTAAHCQTTCVIPGGSASAIGSSASGTSTASVGSLSTSCQLACTTAQLSCHNVCAQQSPSR